MRKAFLIPVVVFVVAFALWLPSDAFADCDCSFITQVRHTCTVGSCTRTITIHVCQGYWNCNYKCIPAYYWRECCGNFVGDAIIFDTCDGGDPLGPVQGAQQLQGSVLARVYVPGCKGGYVPALARRRAAR